jgi:hypothetical protein
MENLVCEKKNKVYDIVHLYWRESFLKTDSGRACFERKKRG